MLKNIFILVALSAALGITSFAQASQTTHQQAKLIEGYGLLKAPKIEAQQMHACQPLQGETVEVIDVLTDAEGIKGFDLAKVHIIDGHCAGEEGWIASASLSEALQ